MCQYCGYFMRLGFVRIIGAFFMGTEGVAVDCVFFLKLQASRSFYRSISHVAAYCYVTVYRQMYRVIVELIAFMYHVMQGVCCLNKCHCVHNRAFFVIVRISKNP